MKLLPFIGVLALVLPSSSQYFSEGWAPGKPVPTDAPEPAFSYDPKRSPPQQAAPVDPSTPRSGSPFSLTGILESRPVADLLGRFGLNISERLESAQKSLEIWDPRVPLITDENYAEMIVNEELTEEEEENRVWFLIITVSSVQQGGVSAYADEQFDEAFNQTVIADDLPFVRWGRIDYINVTSITTKWGVWSAPMIVLLKDRGQTLRFWRPTQIRLRADRMRSFLLEEAWMHTPPWKSAFAPGGKREFVMDWLAMAMTKTYEVIRVMPRWLLYVITGAAGSFVINLLHRKDMKKAAAEDKEKAAAQEKKQKQVEKTENPEPQAASGSSTGAAKSTPAPPTAKGKGRKGGKK